VANGSSHFQLVQEFGQALAAMHGQTLWRMPGHPARAGWKTRGAPGVPDITIHWKREGLDTKDAPPRIVCAAVGSEFGNVDQPGGGRAATGVARERIILVRRYTLQCYVWGQDDEQTEDLYCNCLRAFHHLFSTGEQPGKAPVFTAEVWEDQQPEAGGQSTRGAMISFFATWELTVKDLPTPLVIVKQITNELTLNGNRQEAEYVLVPR